MSCRGFPPGVPPPLSPPRRGSPSCVPFDPTFSPPPPPSFVPSRRGAPVVVVAPTPPVQAGREGGMHLPPPPNSASLARRSAFECASACVSTLPVSLASCHHALSIRLDTAAASGSGRGRWGHRTCTRTCGCEWEPPCLGKEGGEAGRTGVGPRGTSERVPCVADVETGTRCSGGSESSWLNPIPWTRCAHSRCGTYDGCQDNKTRDRDLGSGGG